MSIPLALACWRALSAALCWNSASVATIATVFGIDLLFPDLESEQPGLANDGKRAGQFHAEADFDRFHSARGRRIAAGEKPAHQQYIQKTSHPCSSLGCAAAEVRGLAATPSQ